MIHIEAGEYTPEQLADIVTNHMVENQAKKCLCCAESMSLLSRTMSRQMAGTLRKIAIRVQETDKNDVIPAEFTGDLFLNRTQYANLNVLQKHGLIAHLSIKDGNKRHYCMTRRGYDFITGKIQIPKTVYSLRNKLVRKSEDMVTITDILGEPYTDIRDGLFFNPPENNEVEQVRVYHKVKAKRRKNPCPNCPTGELKKRSIVDETFESTVRCHNEYHCTNCNYKAKEA